nr:alpha/beta hydrolase [Herbiconiux sp.]
MEEARKDPDVFAHKMVKQVTDHYLEAIDGLTQAPAVVGHSFGGLIAQKIAGTGAAEVTVAIDPAPFQGVLPLPVSSLKSSAPVLANPLNFGRAVSLTLEQFTFGWANTLEADEAEQLWTTYHVAASGVPLFQAATANFNPFTETKVDTRNPARGPLLIVSGEHDNTVPRAMTEAAFRIQQKNPALTEFIEMPGRGHSLTIDHGWRGVADEVLAFVTTQTAND